MNRFSLRRRVVPAIAAATLAAVAISGMARLWAGWPLASASAAAPRLAAPQRPRAPVEDAQLPAAGTSAPVPVVLPRLQSVTNYIEITGNAAAVNQVKLIARVTGYLDKIHYQDGAFAKKGDLLFTIQQDPYRQQLQQAHAQVLTAQAALVYAKTEVVRYTSLVKQDAATQTEVDHWNYERASAAAQLLSAQAQVAIDEVNLGYTEIRAPFDGIVGKHLVDPGNVVGGDAQQAALADITQLNPIYVVANLSEQTVLKIRQNLSQHRLTLADLHQVPVDVGLSDEQGFPHRGTIEYVAPALDPATGTLLVRGILPNPDRLFLPGFFVRMRLPMGKVDRNALLVPDRALQTDQGGQYLLVLDGSDVVRQHYVQVGSLMGALRVVTSGLQPEDRVVVGDLWRATPGTKVVPQPTTIEAVTGSAAPGAQQ
ncbi:MAG TPA: efflux RND transporter periplasmic adaptor subunit [Stellaceae bacterium]|jgi:RND family efflux transporter MFP subunit|nr:efflux RND transporter periplasmic adaptor subunit [Stellaceae bacterium]